MNDPRVNAEDETDLESYRGFVAAQNDVTLRGIYLRLCRDQQRSYEERGEMDQRTFERQCVVEEELRSRKIDPDPIMYRAMEEP